MARQKRDSSGSKTISELAKRLCTLCETNWGGNQSRMASDTGLSTATISRTLSGHIDPASLAVAAAALPSINANWLLTGRGLPQSANDGGSGATRYLPTTTGLLDGPVAINSAVFDGTQYPIPDSMFCETRYWHQVSYDQAKIEGLKWMRGDQVLIETNPEWIENPTLLIGRLLVLQIETETEPCFGTCSTSSLLPDAESYFTLELVAVETYSLIVYPRQLPNRSQNKTFRLVVGNRPKKLPKPPKNEIHLTPANVVGLVLRSDRVYGNGRRP